MDEIKHMEAGRAYEDLGLPGDAQAEYDAIPPGSPHYIKAQGERIGSLLTQGRYAEACAQGLAILQSSAASSSTLVINTALALHLDHRFVESLDLLLQNQRLLNSSKDAYQIGTSAARCGSWSWASKAFLYHLRCQDKCDPWFFLDSDVEPWIDYLLREGIAEEAVEGLADPRGVERWLDLPLPEHPIPVDSLLVEMMPESFRGFLIHVPPDIRLHWRPGSPDRLRRHYLQWQHALMQRRQGQLRQIMKNARGILLDLQFRLAEDHAREANFLAARYHALHALRQDLRRFGAFEKILRPLGMGYFLDDILRAACVDTGILERLAAIRQQSDAGRMDPRDGLDEIDALHPRIQETGMVLIERGHLLQKAGRERDALGCWVALSLRWPQDPVGAFNAANILAQHKKWDAAESLLQSLPPASHKILLVEALEKKIADRNMQQTAFIPECPFYGQRNLGGILRMNDQPLKWLSP